MGEAVTGPRRHRAGPSPGNQRRAQMLDALERLLETRALADIGVSDITQAAGVSRPAFYFYFPNTAAAVAALMGDMYENVFRVAQWFDQEGGDPLALLRAGIESTITMWRDRAALMVAVLDAANSDPDVRAVWNEWIAQFEARSAARIQADQERGLARADVDTPTLARVLVGTIFRAMETDVREIRAGADPSPHLGSAVFEVWRRAAYVD